MPTDDSGPNPLEEAFYADEHSRLLEEFRRRSNREQQRDSLRQIVQIKDDAFLDRLITMGVTPETVLALRLIPLVCVAWADGDLDEREREAILRAAEERGVAIDGAARRLLDRWLSRRPDPQLLELWKEYVRQIWGRFTASEAWQMRQNLLATAREVASAAGGFLGLASISAAERAVLDELEKAVEP